MKLRYPESNDKNELIKYIEEHYKYGEDEIHASNMLSTMKYDNWINKLLNDRTIGDSIWGISDTYLAIKDNTIVGMLNIRYSLNNQMAELYGHIGYGVRPTERRKGYATNILKDALTLAKEKGLDEVILGCYKDNIGSIKTIEANNGTLYKEDIMDGKEAVYYKIKL